MLLKKVTHESQAFQTARFYPVWKQFGMNNRNNGEYVVLNDRNNGERSTTVDERQA